MRMRLPVHVWAMLSRGKEAESCEGKRAVRWADRVNEGFSERKRWREFDGERHWKWQGVDGAPCARFWTVSVMRRMVWARRDGRWYGRWVWEEYMSDEDWAKEGPTTSAPLEYNYWWLNMGGVAHQITGGHIPQEVLLHVLSLSHVDWVRTVFCFPLCYAYLPSFGCRTVGICFV